MTSIGLLVALVLMSLAFVESGLKGRVVILAVVSTGFILPNVFPSSAMSVICTAAKLLFGAGCFIFLRYRKAI